MDAVERVDVAEASVNFPPEYVLARRVLLDALAALGPQREAVVLVGAQAIYLQVGEADLAVPVMTTDGDLAVDPARLHDLPVVGEALATAGFVSTGPGRWVGEGGVEIDLMVPTALAGRSGRRGADLGVHGSSAARQATGLEAALVDATVLRVEALDPGDARGLDVAVAGPAALLVAKAHKIVERLGTRRSEDKDALDVLRLLRGSDTALVARRLVELVGDPRAAEVTSAALASLEQAFATPTSEGSRMAARAAFPVEDGDVVAASVAVLVMDLLRAVRR